MKYIFAKIGKQNSEFDRFLFPTGNECSCIPIFFDACAQTRKELLKRIRPKNKGHDNSANDINNFFDAGENPGGYRIILLNNQQRKLFIYKPIKDIFVCEMPHAGHENFAVKLLPVKKVKCVEYRKLPPLLLGLGCNQYLTRGTFREIDSEKYPGVIFSIRKLVNPKLKTPSKINKLSLLDSTQFETFVAKIFEEKGFFVPARCGGNIPEIDLLPKNVSKKDLEIFGKIIVPNESIEVQVKIRSEKITNSTPTAVMLHKLVTTSFSKYLTEPGRAG